VKLRQYLNAESIVQTWGGKSLEGIKYEDMCVRERERERERPQRERSCPQENNMINASICRVVPLGLFFLLVFTSGSGGPFLAA
jgi:hypothetical protein